MNDQKLEQSLANIGDSLAGDATLREGVMSRVAESSIKPRSRVRLAAVAVLALLAGVATGGAAVERWGVPAFLSSSQRAQPVVNAPGDPAASDNEANDRTAAGNSDGAPQQVALVAVDADVLSLAYTPLAPAPPSWLYPASAKAKHAPLADVIQRIAPLVDQSGNPLGASSYEHVFVNPTDANAYSALALQAGYDRTTWQTMSRLNAYVDPRQYSRFVFMPYPIQPPQPAKPQLPRYKTLLAKFEAPQDRDDHGDFFVRGYVDDKTDDVPAGYWVYIAPHWHIYKEDVTPKPQPQIVYVLVPLRTMPQTVPTTSYKAVQATGKPNSPNAGDSTKAWCPETADGRMEWLELTYEKKLKPKAVVIHANMGPGAVVRVTTIDAKRREVELWKGKDPTPTTEKRGVSTIELNPDQPLNRIRIYLDSVNVKGWQEIDAVGLVDQDGKTYWAKTARASSEYPTSQYQWGGLYGGSFNPQLQRNHWSVTPGTHIVLPKESQKSTND